MAHGEYNHIEIPYDDEERAKRFYSGVFGWQFRQMGDFPGYDIYTAGPGDLGGGQADEAARLDEITEDAAQPGLRVGIAGLRRLGELPRLLQVDEPVGGAHELPEFGESCVEETTLECRSIRRQTAHPVGRERALGRARSVAVEIAVDHRDAPVDEVAKVVGQVGVVAPDERIPGNLRVAIEGDLAERHVAGTV